MGKEIRSVNLNYLNGDTQSVNIGTCNLQMNMITQYSCVNDSGTHWT